jgi:CO/xanthine dehydrogenase Mo-binding subunit
VEVISRFIGSGFGCKLFPWPHFVDGGAGTSMVDDYVENCGFSATP